MRRRSVRTIISALLTLLVASCGGGGGGGGGTTSPPVPPPSGGGGGQASITTGNATLVAALGNAFMESFVQLSISALNNVFDLSDSRRLSFDMDCDTFSTGGTISLVDNDGNGLVSAGDVVELDYNNCRQASLGDFATGRINVLVNSFSLGSDLSVAGEFDIEIPANLTFNAGDNTFVDVATQYKLTFTASAGVENLQISTSAAETMRIVIRDAVTTSTEVADQVTINRRIDQNAYRISGSWHVDSDSANGEFDCSITTDLAGTLSQFPDTGTLSCTGAGQSTVRVVAVTASSIVTEVDPEGDGSFVDAGVFENGNGIWGDYVEGQIFSNQVERPRFDPTQQIPTISSVSLGIASGDRAFDAVYDQASDLLYVTNSTGLEVIDVGTLTISGTLAIADRPGPLDLADDGSTIWIALRDTGEMTSVDTATLNEGTRVSLGLDPQFGSPRIGTDLQIVPGTTDMVVVATRDSREVVVYDAGIPLPNTVSDTFAPSVIEFSDASTLFGVRGSSTAFSAARMSVDANGVTLEKNLREYSLGFTEHMAVDDGLIWLESGRAVDLGAEIVVGRFDFEQLNEFGRREAVYIEPGASTAWFFKPFGGLIEFFDTQTFRQLGAYRMAAQSASNAWLFESRSGQLIIVVDNEVHKVDKSSMAPTLLGRTCSTVDLGGQFGPAVFVQIDCVFKDVVYDADNDLLYATLPSAAGRDGNSVAIIDPQTGAIRSYVFVGSEPDRLSISANGTRLFVTLEESNRIAEVDLQAQQLVGYVRLNDEQLLQRPGIATAVAASTQTETDLVAATDREIAAYFAGVQAAGVINPISGVEQLFINAGATRVYAATDNNDLWSFDIDGTGLSGPAETRNVVAGRGVKFEGGELYDTLGAIVDPETATVVASCPASSVIAVEPDPGNDDIYYLRSGVPSQVQVCDRNSLTLRNTFDLPQFGGGFFRPVLRKAGANRLAIMNSDKLQLIDPAEF